MHVTKSYLTGREKQNLVDEALEDSDQDSVDVFQKVNSKTACKAAEYFRNDTNRDVKKNVHWSTQLEDVCYFNSCDMPNNLQNEKCDKKQTETSLRWNRIEARSPRTGNQVYQGKENSPKVHFNAEESIRDYVDSYGNDERLNRLKSQLGDVCANERRNLIRKRLIEEAIEDWV
ncbi:predicted protein [Nematostella vectensis]|uniref:Uncharacterized protein n=1 Tax=Nematostella vectensis TaxID=45351 RepID=A7RZA0_NEMVE|nr:predicted protein [Nematostella vectensis]|eukprot:XP_001635266.1 predicted protein [Nematostella vectensis]